MLYAYLDPRTAMEASLMAFADTIIVAVRRAGLFRHLSILQSAADPALSLFFIVCARLSPSAFADDVAP